MYSYCPQMLAILQMLTVCDLVPVCTFTFRPQISITSRLPRLVSPRLLNDGRGRAEGFAKALRPSEGVRELASGALWVRRASGPLGGHW